VEGGGATEHNTSRPKKKEMGKTPARYTHKPRTRRHLRELLLVLLIIVVVAGDALEHARPLYTQCNVMHRSHTVHTPLEVHTPHPTLRTEGGSPLHRSVSLNERRCGFSNTKAYIRMPGWEQRVRTLGSRPACRAVPRTGTIVAGSSSGSDSEHVKSSTWDGVGT
jgi:hypothetical protein